MITKNGFRVSGMEFLMLGFAGCRAVPTTAPNKRCHSERSEESRPGIFGVVRLAQCKIPRFARNDISSFLAAGRPTEMSHFSEDTLTLLPRPLFPVPRGEGRGGGELG